jgi:hypothetical protein
MKNIGRTRPRVRNVRSHGVNPTREANIRKMTRGVDRRADWYAVFKLVNITV